MALPFGAIPPGNPGPGHAPSAPDKPGLLIEVAFATALAARGIPRIIVSCLVSLRP